VRLGESELPGESSVLDTGPSRRSRSSVVARDEDVVCLGLGDSRGDDSDTDLGDELDRDPRARVLGRRGCQSEIEERRRETRGLGTYTALEVVDELLEILDRVDVVVRGRGDESDSRGRVTSASNLLRDLVSGELSSFSRLGTLRELDLELVGVGEIVGRDSESCELRRVSTRFRRRQRRRGTYVQRRPA
jgi:hypothetical protein